MPSQKTLPKMVLQKKSKKCTKKKEKWHYCLRQPLRSEIGKEGGQKISSFGAQQIFPFQPVTYFTIIMRHEKNPRILCICLMWRLIFFSAFHHNFIWKTWPTPNCRIHISRKISVQTKISRKISTRNPTPFPSSKRWSSKSNWPIKNVKYSESTFGKSW